MSDFVQRMREAVVALLDTRDAIVAITGRASVNVVPWGDLGDNDLPVAAFRLASVPSGGIQDEQRVTVTFRCAASDEATANELAAAIDAAITYPTLAALLPPVGPIDAYRLRAEEGRHPVDYDDEAEAYAADLDVVLVVSKP